MKSLKKTLVLLVVLSMILSAVSPVFAFNDVVAEEYAEQANKMAAFGVFAGDANGNFNADAEITRAEMAVIIGKLMGLTENEANANKVYNSNFSDVVAGDWYTGWVNLVAGRGIISGFPDGTFRPNEKVTQAQAVTMIVKALGWGVVVDQTGTWPANYITKASELRLFKNAVETNSELVTRGNVAIYCYNALTADTWDVTESTNGQLTSSADNTKTILAKYFSDFVNDNNKMKLIEGAKVTMSGALTSTIGVNQVRLDASEAEFEGTTAASFLGLKSNPKNKEEKTYGSGNTVTAYVPADVADIAALDGKKVDVIFGRDNEVAYIVVTDDAYTNVVVTAWDNAKSEIEIDGEAYDVKSNAEVNVFGVELPSVIVNDICDCGSKTDTVDSEDNCTAGAGGTKAHVAYDADTFTATQLINGLFTELSYLNDKGNLTRNVVAEFILDEDEEIESINFKFSKDYAPVGSPVTVDEYVVEKISSKNILTAAGRASKLDLEKVEEDYEPRVIRNGAIATLYDIEVGDVVTEVSVNGNIATVIAVSNTVEGDVTDYLTKTNTLEIDGTDYVASTTIAYNEEGKVDEYQDATKSGSQILGLFEDETVTAYLNIVGEVVAVVGEAEATGTIVGIVTENAEIDEDNSEVEYIKVRIFAEDGTDRNYKIYNKRSGKNIQNAEEYGPKFTEAGLVASETAPETVKTAKNELVAAEKAYKAEASEDNLNTLKTRQNTLAGYLATATVVRFAADSDRIIKSDDIEILATAPSVDFKSESDVQIIEVETSLKADLDNKTLTYDIDADTEGHQASSTNYRYTSATVVMNPATKELMSWETLVDTVNDDFVTMAGGKYWLFVKNSKVIYMISSIAENAYGASSEQYGILVDVNRDKDEDDNTIYVATVLVDGEEKTFECEASVRDIEYGDLIQFKVSEGELVNVVSKVKTDVCEVIADSKNDEDYIGYEGSICVVTDAMLTHLKDLELAHATYTSGKKYEAIKVDSVEVVDGDTFVIFEATGAATIDLAKDYIVYDLANGEVADGIVDGDYILVFDENDDGEYQVVVVL